jgi:hypothetical protein
MAGDEITRERIAELRAMTLRLDSTDEQTDEYLALLALAERALTPTGEVSELVGRLEKVANLLDEIFAGARPWDDSAMSAAQPAMRESAARLTALEAENAHLMHANNVLLGAIESVCSDARTLDDLRKWHEGPRAKGDGLYSWRDERSDLFRQISALEAELKGKASVLEDYVLLYRAQIEANEKLSAELKEAVEVVSENVEALASFHQYADNFNAEHKVGDLFSPGHFTRASSAYKRSVEFADKHPQPTENPDDQR